MPKLPYAPGSVLAGKYRVDRVVGEGGMGIVLAATHLELDEPVAIKVLLESEANPESTARFLREGKASARIRSEHIVRVRDVARLEDGTPFMVMELLEGTDLGVLLEQRGPLAVSTAVDYVLQVCDAVAEAHSAGIVHRDLKPSNLFLTRRRNGTPCVKVLDFGISKVASSADKHKTSTKDIFGSPLYMSPEQLVSTTDVDARSDVWSMAVVLYELLAGKPPFDPPSLAELHVAILQWPVPKLGQLRPDVPVPVVQAIEAALAKKREDRTPSIAAFAAGLAPFASPVGVEAFETLIATNPGASASSVSSAHALTRYAGAQVSSSPALPAASAGASTQSNFTSKPLGGPGLRMPLVAAAFGVLLLVGVAGITSSVLIRRQQAMLPAEPAAPSEPASAIPEPASPASAATPTASSSAEPQSSAATRPAATAPMTNKPATVTTRPAAPRASSTGRAALPDDRR